MENILWRCKNCKAINQIPQNKLNNIIKCGNCKEILNIPSTPIDVGFENFHEEVIESIGLTLVEFWSENCIYCKRMNEILEEFAKENTGKIKVVKINIDREGPLASQFGILTVPTFILFKGGKILGELPGALPKEELNNWILYFSSTDNSN